MASLLNDLKHLMNSSDLVAAVGELRQHGDFLAPLDGYRKLNIKEVEVLRRQGNDAEDWSHIHVAADFRTEFIRNNRLLGRVHLGRFSSEYRDLGHGVCLHSGVYDSVLKDAHVNDEAMIHRVGWLHRAFVGRCAAVVNCSTVTCGDLTTFGCGTLLPLGVQTGERAILAFAELDVNLAARLVTGPRDVDELAEYHRLLDDYLDRIECPCTVIAEEAVILDARSIEDSFVGRQATVRNASYLSNSTVLSNAEYPSLVGHATTVRNSLLQAGSEIDSGAQLDASVLCKLARVGRLAKVSGSLIGPNSQIGLGEVTASLVGAYTSAHHQSLLIATIWPRGRGNVAHAANVGSNHTSRAPDQELWCGEGVFFGLGVNINFPANLSRSPYSIVAAGVSCMPQRVEFPFSLIRQPTAALEGVPTAWNEIRPGWMLAENAFALKRRELRLAERGTVQCELLSKDIVDMMLAAMIRLSAVVERPYYSDQHIAGLGKNYITDKARRVAIEAYERWIDYYLLRGLQRQLTARGLTARCSAARNVLEQRSNDTTWEHQREMLLTQHPRCSIVVLMERLAQHARAIAADVERSKAKDDLLGAKIIDDYAEVHAPANQDRIVRATWDELAELEQDIDTILAT